MQIILKFHCFFLRNVSFNEHKFWVDISYISRWYSGWQFTLLYFQPYSQIRSSGLVLWFYKFGPPDLVLCTHLFQNQSNSKKHFFKRREIFSVLLPSCCFETHQPANPKSLKYHRLVNHYFNIVFSFHMSVLGC